MCQFFYHSAVQPLLNHNVVLTLWYHMAVQPLLYQSVANPCCITVMYNSCCITVLYNLCCITVFYIPCCIKVFYIPCCIRVLYIPCCIKVLYNPCCIIYSRFWPSSCSSAPLSLCCTTSGSCSSWSVISHVSWPPWWERHQRSHWTPPETSSLVRYDVMLLWWRSCNMMYVDITFYTNSENFYRSSSSFI